MGFVAVLRLAISFLPAPVQVLILGSIAILLIFAVFRLIKLVLDSIPFL